MTTTANTDQSIPGGNIETEIVDDGCEWGYGGCIGIGVLTEDPFDRDVNDRTSFTVICGHCAGVRTDEASQHQKLIPHRIPADTPRVSNGPVFHATGETPS